jgi:hypothetical protein
MKMITEHFEYLKQAVEGLDTENTRARYIASGLTTKRYQWDIVREANLTPWVCKVLYVYLDDTHIQTALDRVIPPLQAS